MAQKKFVLPLNYPIFNCADPDLYSEYGSGSKKFLKMYQICIRIDSTIVYGSIFFLKMIQK